MIVHRIGFNSENDIIKIFITTYAYRFVAAINKQNKTLLAFMLETYSESFYSFDDEKDYNYFRDMYKWSYTDKEFYLYTFIDDFLYALKAIDNFLYDKKFFYMVYKKRYKSKYTETNDTLLNMDMVHIIGKEVLYYQEKFKQIINDLYGEDFYD